jgi:outer membrane protein assembly factor BamB
MNDSPPRAVRRIWIPVLSIVVCSAVAYGAWNYTDPDFPNDLRSMISSSAVMLAALMVVLWLLFLSGLRWCMRIGALLAAVGLVFGTVKKLEFQGNMWPIIHWRWEPRHERSQRESTDQVAIPEATPTDFPEYRNRRRDGIVTGLKLDPGWGNRPPKLRWEHSFGDGNESGFGGISVVGPAAVTLEQIGSDEAVVCYDADTGKQRWSYQYPSLFYQIEPMGGSGPRTNPTIADGDVYTFGGTGHLARLDGKTGKPKWTVETLGDRPNVYWGQSGSPLVTDKLVIVSPGRNPDKAKTNEEEERRHDPAVIAFNRDSGTVAWEAGDHPAGYSSPQTATIAGVPQVLVFDAEGLGSYDLNDGKQLWFQEWKNKYDANVAQPLVLDDSRVYINTGYGNGGIMIQVSLKDGKWSLAELWRENRLKCKFSSPVYYRGQIYGIDESAGSITCIDAKNGKLVWKDGRYGNGQILLVGDMILVGSETGKLVLVEAIPANAKYHEVASFQALDGDKNWNYLTVARGRAYVRNHKKMVCYDLPVEK